MKLFTVAVLLCLHADGLLGEDWEKVADKKECGGSEKSKGRKKTVDECAKACRGVSSMFVFGTNDFGSSKCNTNGKEDCLCYCETSSTAGKCTMVDATGYRLYKYVDGKEAKNFEIYYFDHPSCSKAEYTRDVFETYSVRKSKTKDGLQELMETFKKNAPEKYQADIICGAKLMVQDTGDDYVLGIITGTAMKKTVDLGLIPMEAENFEIYYFDHPSCSKAEYTREVFETYSVRKSKTEDGLQNFLKKFKENAPEKYQADIICGAKLMVQDTGDGYVLGIITGTAMKKPVV